MRLNFIWRVWLAGCVACFGNSALGEAQDAGELADVAPLAAELQSIVETADRQRFLSLLGPDADLGEARQFAADAIVDGVTRAVVQPQFLVPQEDASTPTGYDLSVEVFTERGNLARLDTWVLGVSPESATSDPTNTNSTGWHVTSQRSIGGLDTLHHLTLDPNIQFDAENLIVAGEDMTLRLSRGSVFVANIANGTTALVLVGDGTITFEPEVAAEKGQLQIFSGSERLETDFDHAFVRINPEVYASRVSTRALTQVDVDRGDLREAQDVFDELAGFSYLVDLSELSDRAWWLNPGVGDLVAEVATRRYGTLTYVQAQNSPEDITLFQREPNSRIISLYPSARKRAVQGRYFDDQDRVPYDVLDYDIVASLEPRGFIQEELRARARLRGCWIDGRTRIALRIARANVSTLTIRLADELDVASVSSRELGPLPFFRMSGQNNLIVTLPRPVQVGTEFSLTVTYAGLLAPQEPDENWLGQTRHLFDSTEMFGIAEERYIYSSSSHWYPQSTVADYATATMALTTPTDYGVIASGDANEGNPPVSASDNDTGTHTYRYIALQPAKYLSAIVSRFWAHDTPAREILVNSPATLASGDASVSTDRAPAASSSRRSGVRYDTTMLSVETNPRTRDRLDEYYERASDILQFYSGLVGDLPYPVFTLALTDSRLPGGHSPAYFAVLNQPLPFRAGIMWSWRNDPVAFSNVDYFFLAHELAHQWWGQAVGWKNYHEQWLSEAMSHYFAALYVEKDRGDDAFSAVLAQMQQWSRRHSADGPVYLGHRLGAIEEEPRVYRSLVYNKGAIVLHMLRSVIGDDAFFGGLRRYYNDRRFARAGTDDLIRAFELESARSLESFFDRWIHESGVPRLQFDFRTEEQENRREVVLTFEQEGQVFEVPVPVTIKYRSGAEDKMTILVTEQVTEVRLLLSGRLRDVEVNADETVLVEIRR